METTQYLLLNKLMNETQPRYLYHYTNITGLYGILESGTIWATETSFLNDQKELTHAAEAMYRILERKSIANSVRSIGIYTKDTRWPIIRTLSYIEHERIPGIFVCSFCDSEDLLSQWRGYGGGQDGYAIGFATRVLRHCAESSGFTLARCEYNPRKQLEVLNEIAESRISYLLSTECTQQCVEQMKKAILQDVARAGPLLKHSAFAEEREWRLVSRQTSLSDPCVKYRPSRIGLIPHMEINFRSGLGDYRDAAWPALSIVVGPSARQRSSMEALKGYLETRYPGSKVGRSQAPFR